MSLKRLTAVTWRWAVIDQLGERWRHSSNLSYILSYRGPRGVKSVRLFLMVDICGIPRSNCAQTGSN